MAPKRKTGKTQDVQQAATPEKQQPQPEKQPEKQQAIASESEEPFIAPVGPSAPDIVLELLNQADEEAVVGCATVAMLRAAAPFCLRSVAATSGDQESEEAKLLMLKVAMQRAVAAEDFDEAKRVKELIAKTQQPAMHDYQLRVATVLSDVIAATVRAQASKEATAMTEAMEAEAEEKRQTLALEEARAEVAARSLEREQKDAAVKEASEAVATAQGIVNGAQERLRQGRTAEAEAFEEGEGFKRLRSETWEPLKAGTVSGQNWRERNKMIDTVVEVLQEVVDKCPKEHILHLQQATTGATCDDCHKEVAKGDNLWGCRLCNFDKCDDCHGKTQVGRDESLEAALVQALKTKSAERGPFSNTAMEHATAALERRGETLEERVRVAGVEVRRCEEAAASADAAKLAAEQRLSASALELQSAVEAFGVAEGKELEQRMALEAFQPVLAKQQALREQAKTRVACTQELVEQFRALLPQSSSNSSVKVEPKEPPPAAQGANAAQGAILMAGA